MVRSSRMFVVVLAAWALFIGQALRAEEGEKHGHAKAPHGGEMQELGDKEDTHAEVVHDPQAGKLTLYLLAKDQKTPLAIKEAPKLNLKAKDGNKQLVMKAVEAKDGAASQFEATDEALKADPLDGRIGISLGDGKKYHVSLKHEHK